jgi:hypothetical protein
VLVYAEHAPFIAAINGRSVTVRGSTLTLNFPAPQSPPLRRVYVAATREEATDAWGAALRDLDGVEP